MKKILVPVIALAICSAILWKWTLGFSSFTVFSYTLDTAGEIPRAFPDLQMIDHNGNTFSLKDKGKYILLNFVYLDCPSVCHKVNNRLENIYHSFDSSVAYSRLEFVTLSFDLKNDDIRKIRSYREHFGKDISGWSFALPYQSDQERFDRFLHNAGIWKYTNPATNITNHSVYLFLIAPDNKIVRVFDPARESDKSIVEQITACLKNQTI
ncbi:hypothetical protein MASR2M18_07370 [Ignavibacteria bacterium]|nr:SCO family protein [Bacteroidota bacterium]MCZ2132708.1 SCO family protein [Bacteroidota bacterium]